MRLMLIAVLLSAQLTLNVVAQQPGAAEAETTRLLIVVAGNDRGAAFLRQAKPALERLRGRVASAEPRRNSVLKREETKLVLSFDSTEAATNFMNTLAGGGPGPTEGGSSAESGSNYSCAKEGMSKVCYFRFGEYRFVCVQTYKNSGSCGQIYP